MKRIVMLVALFVMAFTVSLSAQKPFAGHIHYSFTVEGIDDPNVLAQMPESVDVTVFGNKTKTVMNMQGVGIQNITDGDAKLTLTIIEVTGMGKYYVELPADSIEKKFKNVQCDATYTGETKDIAGYLCKRVVVVLTDLETDETQETVIWVSDSFLASEAINFGSQYRCVKGYPLRTETTVDQGDTKFTIIQEAKEIKPDKKVKALDFLRPSDAKNLMEEPELKKMFGL